jgi:hypothetical protein
MPKCDLSKGEKTNCTSRTIPDCAETGYSAEWYARVLAEGQNAAHYAVPASATVNAHTEWKMLRMDKKRK